MINHLFRICFVALIAHSVIGQGTQKELSEYGRMYPLTGEVISTYREGYNLSEAEWYQKVKSATLRFNSGCTASFVSESGLLITAAHCSSNIELQNPNIRANVFNNGYLATSLDAELKASYMSVELLVNSVDITDELILSPRQEITEGLINSLKRKYSVKPEYKDLTLEVKRYYNDKSIVLNGYKKYKDVRLVFMPKSKIRNDQWDENQDCVPTYDFDVAFWRVYERGGPLDTKRNHLKMNQFNTKKGEVVFVAGYPGNTDRYKSPAELQYLASQKLNYKHEIIKDKIKMLKNSVEDSQDVDESNFVGQMCRIRAINSLNHAVNSSNGMEFVLEKINKAVTIDRIVEIASQSSLPQEYFDLNLELEEKYNELSQDAWALTNLSPSPMDTSWDVLFLHRLEKYRKSIVNKESESTIKALMQDAFSIGQNFGSERKKTREQFKLWLYSIQKHIPDDDPTLSNILMGKTVEDYIDEAFSESGFGSYEKSKATMENRDELILMTNPIMILANKISKRYLLAKDEYIRKKPIIDSLNNRLLDITYSVLGDKMIPDADGTLRLSDGYIAGYNYCGFDNKSTTFNSIISSSTTGQPDQTLLAKLPVDYRKRLAFVSSTNDGTGGNSGSPLINLEGEFIGLVFKQGGTSDYPNDYIYDPKNRAISIHGQAIYLCMKYIYGSDSLVREIFE